MRLVSICLSVLMIISCGNRIFEKRNPEDDQSERRPTVEDTVYEKKVLSSESWRVDGGKFYHNDVEVKLRGLSWFGFETPELVVHGLWTGRTIDSYLKQVAELGFNAVRIPVSPQVFEDSSKSQYGKPSPMANLTELLDAAKERDLFILFDLHTCRVGGGMVGGPYECGGYGEAEWFKTLGIMAKLAEEYPNILGIDLFNEPHKLSWSQWNHIASKAAKHVLGINSKILIVIEGVGGIGMKPGDKAPNWGGNLMDAGMDLPDVPKSRLVFSPHTYGPSVYVHSYFSRSAGFPNNMPAIWEDHFGYLVSQGYAVVPGEFGGRYTGEDKVWQDTFIDYMVKKDMKSFFYWCLNPNSGDTGGILNDDWTTANKDKMDLIKKLF